MRMEVLLELAEPCAVHVEQLDGPVLREPFDDMEPVSYTHLLSQADAKSSSASRG